MLAARSLPPVLAAVALVTASAAAGIALVVTNVHDSDDGMPTTKSAFELPADEIEAPAPKVAPAPYVAEVVDEPAHELDTIAPERLMWIVGAGDRTFVQLAPADEDLPLHNARFTQHEPGEGMQVAVADVRDADVPADLRAWKGKEVIVADTDCRAHITGFAVYASLSGAPSYAGLADDAGWNVDAVLHAGEPTLVGVLDGCAAGTWARDASLPEPYHATVTADFNASPDVRALADAARADFLSTPAGVNDLVRHAAADSDTGHKPTALPIDVNIVEDTRTNTRLIVIHTENAGNGCGDPNEFSTTAIYKDLGNNALSRVYLGESPFNVSGQIFDVDNDGELEVVSDGSVSGFRDELRSTRRGSRWFGCPC